MILYIRMQIEVVYAKEEMRTAVTFQTRYAWNDFPVIKQNKKTTLK